MKLSIIVVAMGNRFMSNKMPMSWWSRTHTQIYIYIYIYIYIGHAIKCLEWNVITIIVIVIIIISIIIKLMMMTNEFLASIRILSKAQQYFSFWEKLYIFCVLYHWPTLLKDKMKIWYGCGASQQYSKVNIDLRYFALIISIIWELTLAHFNVLTMWHLWKESCVMACHRPPAWPRSQWKESDLILSGVNVHLHKP